MKIVARFTIMLVVATFFCGKAFAVERSYGLEQIPAKTPYQRAFLIFYKGSETLILQSKYEMLKTSPAKSLCWVVPVPSMPEITTLEPKNAHAIFWFIAMMTQPKIIAISEYIFLLFLVISGIFCFIYPFLVLILLIQSRIELCLKLLPFFIIALIYIFFALPQLSKASGISDVDVIRSEQVGLYDVQVIKSDSENAILTWLNENGFEYGDSDIDVFKNYIEKQWCFVVAKVQPNSESNVIADRGIVAPLILKFKTNKATYPLALTSLIDKETEVLIYTLTENKQTCSTMSLKRSRIIETNSDLGYYFSKFYTDINTILEGLPAKMNICKFKAKLTQEQMKEDIVFETATDNEPYNETKIVW